MSLDKRCVFCKAKIAEADEHVKVEFFGFSFQPNVCKECSDIGLHALDLASSIRKKMIAIKRVPRKATRGR